MARARTYDSSRAHGRGPSLPSVFGMHTAGGAGYEDGATLVTTHEHMRFPRFPTSWLGRIHTPVGRVAASFGVAVDVWDPRTGNRRVSGN